MTPAPKRRWFRFAFSLRTLFIAVTAFGVYLGWEINIVHERQNLLKRIEATGGKAYAWDERALYFARYMPEPTFPKIAPWRNWLGDRAFLRIDLKQRDPDFKA